MIVVDSSSPVPPFDQVRGQLAAEIADGTLPPGTRLPTVRRLAGDLGLAVNTVARAYRELETAGLVETKGRGGTIVTAGGDRARAEMVRAAAEFAARSRALGVDSDDALAIVATALTTSPHAGRVTANGPRRDGGQPS